MIGLEIRPARKSDAAALAILVDIAGEGIPSYMWSSMRAPGQSALEVGRMLAARAQVAAVGGEVAACLVDYHLDDPYDAGDLSKLSDRVRPLVELEAKAPGSWYVNVLAAFPEYRGQGIGVRLALADERGHARRAQFASIIVASENAGAMRLYSRTGYREIARATVVVPGCAHGGDWVLMIKPI